MKWARFRLEFNMLLLEDHFKQHGSCESLKGYKLPRKLRLGPRTGVQALTRARKYANMNMTTREQ